ncbi:MAG: FecR domain-containing protein [bacterium]
MNFFNASSLALLLYLPSVILSAEESHWVYEVKQGDTIWELSHRYLANPNQWDQVQALNQVDNARHLSPGQQLKIPIAWMKQRSLTASTVQVSGQANLIVGSVHENRPLRPGDQIKPGDRIATDPNSQAIVEFPSGTQLEIGPDSDIELKKATENSQDGSKDVQLQLHRGKVKSHVIHGDEGRYRFQILSPAGVSSVKGTEFRTTLETGSNTTRTEVDQGTVENSNNLGARDIPSGYGLRFSADDAIMEPRALLPAPTVPRIHSLTTLDQLQWPVVADAVNYNIEYIAADSGVYQQFTTANHWVNIKRFKPGTYMVKINAVDQEGLEGKQAEVKLKVRQGHRPGITITPSGWGIIVTSELPEGFSQAELQLSSDLKFTQLLGAYPFTDGQLNLPSLLPGQYYARAVYKGAEDTAPLFSVPQLILAIPGSFQSYAIANEPAK